MTDPLSAVVNAIPGLTKAMAAIANATDPHKRQAQFAELQQALIQLSIDAYAIQTQNLSLLKLKDDLEKQIVRMENWDSEKKRYALTPIWEGAVAYALKKSQSNGEPPHWLCPNCFQERKSFLSPFEDVKWYGVCCSICSTKMQGPYSNAASPEYAQG